MVIRTAHNAPCFGKLRFGHELRGFHEHVVEIHIDGGNGIARTQITDARMQFEGGDAAVLSDAQTRLAVYIR